MEASDRLREVLGGPDLAWVRERVRRRLARGAAVGGVTTLAAPSETQVAAVARLLGRPFRPVGALRVDLDEVSAALARGGLARDVAAAVVALEGRVEDHRAAAREREAAWAAVVQRLRAGLTGEWVDGWVDGLAASGLLKRAAGSDPTVGAGLVERVLTVMGAIPARQVSRARFAAEVLGDAHALDRGGLATLVRSGVRARFGEPALSGAEGRVETWASAGILVGDLTSTVLVAGFGDGPRVWTLRQVAREEVDLRRGEGRTVWVVENPAVVAEAVEALGESCPPMLCASGQPTVAVLALLRRLAGARADLAYHGDFDWDGLRVANLLVERVGVRPWRFAGVDYRWAVEAGRAGVPLKAGRQVEATWDPALAPAMSEVGLAVEEEAVLDRLLDDMARPGAAPA